MKKLLVFLLFTSSAFAGTQTLTWDVYSGTADGFNMYRSDDILPRVWVKVNAALIPVTDTTYVDTAPPGAYCWQLKAEDQSVESAGSNISCDVIEVEDVTGLSSQ